MVVTYAIVGFVVHHPVGSGGIGKFTLLIRAAVEAYVHTA